MSDKIQFECPLCGKVSTVPGKFAGKKGKCPGCKEAIQVPHPEGEELSLKAEEPRAARGDDMKDCRYCGESIKRSAKKCRHCGEFLDRSLRDAKRERHRPVDIPIILKIWGILIMIFAGLCILGGVIQLVALPGEAKIFALIGIAIYFVIFRMGLGLYRGKKMAVIGLCILGGLGLLGALSILSQDAGAGGIFLLVMLVIYGPPIGLGFANWSKLT